MIRAIGFALRFYLFCLALVAPDTLLKLLLKFVFHRIVDSFLPQNLLFFLYWGVVILTFFVRASLLLFFLLFFFWGILNWSLFIWLGPLLGFLVRCSLWFVFQEFLWSFLVSHYHLIFSLLWNFRHSSCAGLFKFVTFIASFRIIGFRYKSFHLFSSWNFLLRKVIPFLHLIKLSLERLYLPC